METLKIRGLAPNMGYITFFKQKCFQSFPFSILYLIFPYIIIMCTSQTVSLKGQVDELDESMNWGLCR